MVSWRMIRPKREEITVGWRNMHSEKIHNLCSLWNNSRLIKWRRMRCSGHAACVGELRNVRKLVGKLPP